MSIPSFHLISLSLLFLSTRLTLGAEGVSDAAELRTWTSADGMFHVMARLAEVRKDGIVLERQDGKRFTVPRAKLSGADLDYVGRCEAGVETANPAQRAVPPAKQSTGVAAPGGPTQREFCRKRLEFILRLTRDVYRREGKTNPVWDDAAVKFLETMAASTAFGDSSFLRDGKLPAATDLREQAEALRKLGCEDPLVLTGCLRTLPNKSYHDLDRQVRPALNMLEVMQRGPYPPLQVAEAAAQTLRVCELLPQPDQGVKKVLADQILAAFSAKEFPGMDRRFVLLGARQLLLSFPPTIQFGHDSQGGIFIKPVSPNEFYDRLRDDKNADRWLSCMILGTMERDCGIQLAHPDQSLLNIGIRPSDPRQRWEAARRYFTEAWKLHPEFPEAATEMAALAGAGGCEGETPRLWFNRAVAAQFDWLPAYDVLRTEAIKTGKADAVFVLGRECLQSSRYDTLVPYQYLSYLKTIASLTHSPAIWQRPGVDDELRRMFRGYEKDACNGQAAVFACDEACCAYLNGRLNDARQAFDKLGDVVDLKTIASYGIDAESMFGQTFAGTGPLKTSFVAMQKAAAAGNSAEAAKLCRDMLAKIDKKNKARPYLRNRSAALNIEAQLAGGDWVNIQPDADLAGWTAARGEWSVDAQGGLIGRLDIRGQDPRDRRGMTLLCRARVGTRFELRGHAEIIEPNDKFAGYGAIVAYAYPGNYWECFFYRVSASICCSLHHNPHHRPAASKPSDDFRIIVYDDQVATAIGKPREPDELPFFLDLEHDPPTATTPFGVGADRGRLDGPPVCMRFTELKLRRLSAPPTKMKIPEPE
jgi:hypothetical protein